MHDCAWEAHRNVSAVKRYALRVAVPPVSFSRTHVSYSAPPPRPHSGPSWASLGGGLAEGEHHSPPSS